MTMTATDTPDTHLRRGPGPLVCGETGPVPVTDKLSDTTCKACVTAEDIRQDRAPDPQPAPTSRNRRCCDTPMNQAHRSDCTSKGGRVTTTGTNPTRAAGRHGKIWDDCVVRAANDGQAMSAFVGDAIRRELALRQLADANGTTADEIMARLTAVPAPIRLTFGDPSGLCGAAGGDGLTCQRPAGHDPDPDGDGAGHDAGLTRW